MKAVCAQPCKKFKPIPGVRDGKTHLTIYPPGTWMDRPDFVAFVGGCGVGQAKTLKEAKQILLSLALGYCDRQITDAEAQRDHYRRQRSRLFHRGLESEK